jgi:hypothetical protein
MRRFTSTPHTTNMRLMQRVVCLETNSRAAQALALKFFERYQHGITGPPEFLWRVICESDPQVQSTAVRLSAFSDPGLRYVNIGQRGFLAVDLNRREATAFLADMFLDDESRFRHRPPLDILFCMTAPSLGLTTLSGGCVGLNDRGVLVFGPPDSGKTTACYLASQLGMEFHADHVVFLDMNDNILRAWGDSLPAVFRPEALDFLPELRPAARRSTYADLSFYYYDKSALQAPRARAITPVCSLFLKRGTSHEAQLKEITREACISGLRDCLLFNEDEQFDAQITKSLNAIASAPVYELKYGSDPKIAAGYIEKLLR